MYFGYIVALLVILLTLSVLQIKMIENKIIILIVSYIYLLSLLM